MTTLIAGALVAGASGCAKDATGLLLNVTANGTLPDIAALHLVLDNATYGEWTGSYTPLTSPPEAGPPLFVFPTALQVYLPPAYTGPTEITVTAPDWTAPVTAPVTLAEGHASAEILGGKQIAVDVALTATGSSVTGDAGTDTASNDGSPDAGSDDASDGDAL